MARKVLLTSFITAALALTLTAPDEKKPETGKSAAAGEHFAQVMEVTGTETSVRGIHTIYVQGLVKK
jgi:hypothetical protein